MYFREFVVFFYRNSNELIFQSSTLSTSAVHASRSLPRRSAAVRSKTVSSVPVTAVSATAVPARLRSNPSSRGGSGLSMTFAQAKEKIQTNIRNMSKKIQEVDYEVGIYKKKKNYAEFNIAKLNIF